MEAGESDLSRREEQQKIHYFFLKELQNLARELPGKYQQRISYDMLCSLASALLDGTVFEIVRSMAEVQHLEEKSMYNQRLKLVTEHKEQKIEMQKRHKEAIQDCQIRMHNLPIVQVQNDREWEVMQQRFEDEVKRKDMKIILVLDQKVLDQQSTLEKAGVPGFYVTNKPHDVRIQMYLLEFIMKLSRVEVLI